MRASPVQAKKKDLKSVTGYTRGTGEKRNIRASYIVEAPVWKTTYRVLFNNKSTRHTPIPARTRSFPVVHNTLTRSHAPVVPIITEEVKSIIEGWALVDNTQNEDWRGVQLSLVSGASNSFIYDLYNPRYAARTEVLSCLHSTAV
jgi:hypothetical protein